MKNFVRSMVNKGGRTLRIIVGLVLIAVGAFFSADIKWTLILIGIIPLAAGLFDFCLLAPLMGYNLNGRKTRSKVNN
ncbi:YgaP family membrane protein [Autumnicola psychrophila]|uniref:YgaP family membrane protein n=1 Tax=Autumnicola psychrophila TaxID=3075592 RepID=UPI003D7831B0